jgi:hypothetical protein
MNRLLVLALTASVGVASPAFAGESLLTSAARHVQEVAVAQPAPAAATAPARQTGTVPLGQTAHPSYQAEGGTLSRSGMSKGKKTLIYVGLAVGFAASVWTIDHHVLDVTPSSLGTRQD